MRAYTRDQMDNAEQKRIEAAYDAGWKIIDADPARHSNKVFVMDPRTGKRHGPFADWHAGAWFALKKHEGVTARELERRYEEAYRAPQPAKRTTKAPGLGAADRRAKAERIRKLARGV